MPSASVGDVAGVRGVDVVLRGQVQHARAPHVLEQRLRSPSRRPSRRSKKTPSRSPASVASRPSKPPASQHALHDDRARQDQVGARRLDARARSRARPRAARRGARTSSSSASRSITIPCTPLDGSPAARWAAAARLRTVPPMPTRRPPSAAAGVGQPVGLRELARRRARAAPPAAGAWPARSAGRKRSLMRTVPSAPGAGLAREAVGDAHELQRAAAEVEHAAVARASSS